MSNKKSSVTQTLNLDNLLKGISLETDVQSVGTITSFSDGVLKASGLDDVQAGELVDLGFGELGLVMNLEKEEVGIVALGDARELNVGDTVRRTGRILSVGVSDAVLGRVVDSLGRPLDGKGEISVEKYMPMEKIAPGIMARQSVSQPLQTGVKAIDAMIPVGRGQRELIIGDRSTGKTAIALGTILNQADEDMICIYVCIGQKRASLAQITQVLEENDAMKYTVVVAATASEAAASQFLVPYTGVSIAEYFLEKGKDVLIVYDDLTKHAQAYREISLLLRRPSGREAYPGDVFFLHSRLLERACRLNKKHGGGSITALPIIETQANDVSAYISTNVISITDGQIYLETDLFNSGMKPAINVGLSVSRVGSAAQMKSMKKVAGSMKLDLAQYRELQAFAQFSSDLDDRTKAQLDRGIRVNAILKQGWDKPLKVEEQVVIIYAAIHGFLDAVREESVGEWEKLYMEHVHNSHDELLRKIAQEKQLTDEIITDIEKMIKTFNNLHKELLITKE